MDRPRLDNFFRFLSLLIMASTFLPIVFANLPPVIKSHHLYTSVWFMALIVFRPQIFRDAIFLFALGYGAFLFMLLNTTYMHVDEEFTIALAEEFYCVVVVLSVLRYYSVQNDYLGLALLVRNTFYCIMITAALSIVTSYINPLYARDLIGQSDLMGQELEEVLAFRRFGGGQYDFFSGIICLFPILIYYYQNKEYSYWTRNLIIVFVFVLFFCLIRVQIFANILIASLIIFLSFLGSVNRKRNLITIGLFALMAMLVPAQYYVELFAFISDQFEPNTELHLKFKDFSDYLKPGGGEDTGAARRAERFPLLLESFLSNPLTGGDYGNHHMYWMNKLAVFGLLCFVPFVMLLIKFIRRYYSMFHTEFAYFFMLSIFSIIALGFMKALVGRNLWYIFFMIVPGFYYLPLLKKRPALQT